jgi:alpha-L-fucosidase
MLVDCVSKNGNLLLNVGPDATGEIPPESVRVLETVGEWMRLNGESITGCGAADLPRPAWGRFTRKGDALYAHVFEKPMGPIAVERFAGRIKRARVVADGSEVDIRTPHLVRDNTTDAFLVLPGTRLPDESDTVIRLDLND